MTKLQRTVKQLVQKYAKNNYYVFNNHWGPYGIFMKAKLLNGIKEKGWRMFFPPNIADNLNILKENDNGISYIELNPADSIMDNFKRIVDRTGVSFV